MIPALSEATCLLPAIGHTGVCELGRALLLQDLRTGIVSLRIYWDQRQGEITEIPEAMRSALCAVR